MYSDSSKAEELAENINKLLLNEEVKRELIVTGLANVQRFRPERTFSQLNKVYCELLKNSNK